MGPWLMLPHGHPASDELGRMLGVRGIPSATVVDAMMQPQYSLDVGEAVNNALREAQRGLNLASGAGIAKAVSDFAEYKQKCALEASQPPLKPPEALLVALHPARGLPPQASSTLLTIARNAASSDDDKFRRLKGSNKAIQERVLSHEAAVGVLRAMGWDEAPGADGAGGTLWTLPASVRVSPETVAAFDMNIAYAAIFGGRVQQAPRRAGPAAGGASGGATISAAALQAALAGAMAGVAQPQGGSNSGGGAAAPAPMALDGEDDAALAARLQAEEDAAAAATVQRADAQQQQQSSAASMKARLESAQAHVAAFHDEANITRALSACPLERLQAEAASVEATEGPAQRDALLATVTKWFKHEFFTWFEPPKGTDGQPLQASSDEPTAEERKHGAQRVEVYTAADGTAHRFPRFNDPSKLLDTRVGRCGEWANCFALVCTALGFEARHVIDWTDHVWVEVWSAHRGRWVHVDPCENAIDTPLLYEQGWGKRLSYCIAFSRAGAADVTRRYTRPGTWEGPDGVLTRRKALPEPILKGLLTGLTNKARGAVEGGAAAVEALEARDVAEQQELAARQAGTFDAAQSAKALGGRITGSVEWRAARGELGDQGATEAAATDDDPAPPPAFDFE